MTRILAPLWLLLLAGAPACSGGDTLDGDSAATDADADTDSDADTDTDSDADTDTDTDTDTPPVNDSEIAKVQQGAYAPGSIVTLTGVLTHDESNYGFYLTDGVGGPYSGLWVYSPGPVDNALVQGDEIEVTGELAEYSGATAADAALTELMITADTDVVLLSQGNPLPAPSALDDATLSDPALLEVYEGVQVMLSAVAVSDADLGGGEWAVTTTGGASLRVDDQLYAHETVLEGATFDSITGLLNHAYGTYKLEPRSGDDFVGYAFEEPPCTAEKCVGDLVAGDLVITELMANPASCTDASCEWLELYNASGSAVDLNGLVLEDNGGRLDVIADSVVVVSEGRVVLGTGSSSSWGHAEFTPDVHWGTRFILGNAGGSVALGVTSTGVVVDSLSYPSDAGVSGFSWALSSEILDATDNDDAAGWCHGEVLIGASVDHGSPGLANGACGSTE